MRLSYAAPDKNLARELRQVKLSAKAVEAAMDQANFLPSDFPREVLVDICSSLAGLEQGTAENSRPALEFARNKIPEIRRQFFHLEEEDSEAPDLDLEAPRLYRGMALDRHLNTLIGSVTTALDEYRVQAQQRFDDEVRGEEIVVLRKPEETEGPTNDASDVIEASERAYSGLQEKEIDRTEKGEILARRLKDGSNLAYAARSQIRGGKIVKRWFEGITKAILALPNLISQAGKGVKVGTDVADILADWWSETQHALLKCSIDQIRRFGVALENIGETLNRREALPSMGLDGPKLPRDPDVLQAETEVERCLRAGVKVPNGLARLVKRLQFRVPAYEITRIKRWQDVALCENLVSIVAYQTDFDVDRHLAHLFGLSQLVELRLPAQDVKDISELGRLVTLAILSIYAPNVVDISVLGKLTRLTQLSLQVPEVADISPLERLTGLTSLSLTANNAKDLTALGKLTDLTFLSLTVNSAEQLTSLEKLVSLTTLRLNAPNLAHMPALEKFTNLTTLSFHTNALANISQLAKLTNLTSLSLTANNVEDLSALEKLTRLTTLSLSVARARDISALAQLTNLKSLLLQATQAPSISALEKLTDLTSLNLQANAVVDISPLEKLTGLSSLILHVPKALDISALENLNSLTSLHLQANSARDISVLEQLTSLTSLSLTSRVISPTLSKLFGLRYLTRLNLDLLNWDWLRSLATSSNVEHLVLGGSGQLNLAHLSGLRKLRTLKIGDLYVTNRDALPGVDIIHSRSDGAGQKTQIPNET